MTLSRTTVTPAGGCQFEVIEEGYGFPILIVHPGSSTSSSWAQVASRLAGRFHVLRYDRLPYRSQDTPEPAEVMAREVADVLAVAARVGRPLLLVGHSSGAVVALESALAGGSSVAGLLLYEPPVAVTEPLGGAPLVRAKAAVDAGKPGRAIRIHLREIVRMPACAVRLMPIAFPVWRQVRGFAAGQINDGLAIESLGVGIDRYRGVDVPALLLGGASSPPHLRGRLEALAGVLPQVQSVIILPGQGHVANVRAPLKVAQVIEAFADSLTF